MNIVVILFIAVFMIAGGLALSIAPVLPMFYKSRNKQYIHWACCGIVLLMGIILLISVMKSPYHVVETKTTVYDIEKMSFGYVVYEKDETKVNVPLNSDTKIDVALATDEYKNVVVVETINGIREWWTELTTIESKSTVYLEKQLYEQYTSGLLYQKANQE